MNRIKSCTLLVSASLVLTCALNQGRAQEYANLPDDPGLTAKPAAEGLARDYANLPDDHGQTMKPAVDTTTGVPQREATWRSLPGDFLHDQKDIWWTFPKQLAHGRHWVPTLIVVGGTAGLIYADPHAMPYFQTHQRNWDDFNDVFDPMITTAEVITLPTGLITAGYIRHDDREVNTAILAAEAYADTVVVNLAIKAVTRRQRPADVAQNGSFTGTFFNGGKSPLRAAVSRRGTQQRCGQWRRWLPSAIGTGVSRGFRSCVIRWLPPSVARASPRRRTSHRMSGLEPRSASPFRSTRRCGLAEGRLE